MKATVLAIVLSSAALAGVVFTAVYLISDPFRYAGAQEVDSYLETCGCIVLKCIQKSPLYSALETPRTLFDTLDLSDDDVRVCANVVDGLTDYTVTLADQNGKVTQDIKETVGAIGADIYRLCGRRVIRERFNFSKLSVAVIELFIPWFMLAVALPFMAGNAQRNVLSGLMALGNPIWAGACMALTLAYGIHVYKQGRTALVEKPERKEVINDMVRVTRTWLQSPIRINTRQVALRELLTRPQWWAAMRGVLARSELDGNPTFYFPFVMAIGVWLWTLQAAFQKAELAIRDASGSNLEWQITVGNLFMFMIPLTFGWRAQRIQATSGTNEEALEVANTVAMQTVIGVGSGFPLAENGDDVQVMEMRLRIPTEVLGPIDNGLGMSQLSVDPDYPWSALGPGNDGTQGARESQSDQLDNVQSTNPETLPFCEEEGESLEKDIVITMQTVQTDIGIVTDADIFIDHDPESLNRHQHRPDSWIGLLGGEAFEGPLHSPWRFFKSWRLSTIIFDTMQNDSSPIPIFNYSTWNEIKWHTWVACSAAIAFGLGLDLGTTGAAVMVLYRSVPRGFGCLSGGLLFHLIGSIFSTILKCISVLCGHHALMTWERAYHSTPVILRARSPPSSHASRASIALRIIGNTLDAANGLWLILWCFLVFSSARQQPYCSTAYFGLGEHGWSALWRQDLDQFISLKMSELRWLACGLVVAYVSCVGFWVLARWSGRKVEWTWARAGSVLMVWTMGAVGLVVPLFWYAMKTIRNLE